MSKNIVIVSGSPRNEKSQSLAMAKHIVGELGYIYTAFGPYEWNINPCMGCGECFMTGRCVMHDSDDTELIIKTLKQADGIIFVSPVYVGTVTGQMKLLIDRLALQHHLMPLIGIPAVAISMSSGNHHQETARYLKNSLEWMGACIVAELPLVRGVAKDDELIKDAVQSMKDAIEGHGSLVYTENQARCFDYYNVKNQKCLEAAQFLPELFGEALAWHNQGYDEFISINEASEKRKIHERI